ncbi:MAG TPA: glycosyltransferase family 4 protein [Alphaproteobacteria bacterium]|jgi:glycosyltransferase involved in cell wall biosynthesis
MTAPLKIAFLIPSVTAGGAERVAATLCNQWAETGHAVSLMTFEAPGASPHYQIDEKVRVRPLDLLRQSRSMASFMAQNVRRVLRVRRELRALSPDIVVSFMPEPNVVALLAGVGQAWSTVVSERVHPAYVRLGRAPALMRRLTYPLAAVVVAQTGVIAGYIERRFCVTTYVIPNPIDQAKFHPPAAASSGKRRRVLSAGRLDHQKGFDILIEAFARVAAAEPLWDLWIFGEGGLKADLTRQIESLGLTERVRLAGVTTDMASELQQADLYVHASRFEGFPNAVMEALACGCAVVAADCAGGVRELLQGQAFGRLVPVDDATALASEMRNIMSDDQLREEMRAKAPQAVAPLVVEKIAGDWISLFRRIRPSAGSR